MSNSFLSDLPDNIRLIPEAEEEFLELDHHQQILVLKGLKKIARDPVKLGKPLGNRGKGKARTKLVNFKSIRIDKSNLRIIWTVLKDGRDLIEVAIVVGMAARSEGMVYEMVSKRRDSAKEIAKDLSELYKKRPE